MALRRMSEMDKKEEGGLYVAYVNLGAALIAAGRCQEAVSVLRQGSRLDGTGLRNRKEHETARVSALLQLGALYSDQGRLQRALAAYREAAHSLPEHYPPQVSESCR
ncbi:MalT-like TPR region [Popillia japonica]|uniref:MalT-like TPR region n=1 Tax=Popillia japonica TaxID=7064 RepID=A0AAW1LBE5_POPJA